MKLSSRPLLFAAAAAASAAIVACGSSAVTNVTGPTATRCQVSITNSSPSFAAAGGAGEVRISVARECAWTATTTPSGWIAITAGQEGQGDGTIAFRVAENADPITRKAAIVVGDQRTDVAQAGAACRYTVSAPPDPIAGAGGQTTVDVRTHSLCEWTAASDASWVTLNPASGRGDAQLRVEAAPNAGGDRTFTLTIGDARVVLRQTAPPQAPPPPPPPPADPKDDPKDPPKPVPITLSGEMGRPRGSCPSVTFDLKGYVIQTSGTTEFQKGNCKDLKDEREVTVRGELTDKTNVRALRIEFKK